MTLNLLTRMRAILRRIKAAGMLDVRVVQSLPIYYVNRRNREG